MGIKRKLLSCWSRPSDKNGRGRKKDEEEALCGTWEWLRRNKNRTSNTESKKKEDFASTFSNLFDITHGDVVYLAQDLKD